MTREEALEMAREVETGKSRSYVTAAICLAKWLLEDEKQRQAFRLRNMPLNPAAQTPSLPPGTVTITTETTPFERVVVTPTPPPPAPVTKTKMVCRVCRGTGRLHEEDIVGNPQSRDCYACAGTGTPPAPNGAMRPEWSLPLDGWADPEAK